VAEVVDLGILGNPPVLSGYLVRSGGSAAIVDAGSASVADEYVSRARGILGGARLEYVLITHVHLDHAGGTARVLELEPGARAAVYSRGAKHLVDPSRLLASSREVLGPLVDEWGGIRPVDPGRIIVLEDGAELDLGGSRLRLIATPGHAPHSSAWYLADEGVLFPGDSAGMLLIGEGGLAWPTAPPPFRMDMFLDSLSRMESLNPRMVCVPHYGCTRRAIEYLRETRRVYLEVDRAIGEACGSGARDDREVLGAALRALGIADAPVLDVLERELMRNIRGLPGYSRCSRGRG
jgi:hydroxyacylglutathione hydrolase